MVLKSKVPAQSVQRVETAFYRPGMPMGNVFYVDSTSSNKGTSTSYGRSPESPFSTLAAAFDSGLLTANNDDYIFLMPGHAETVSAAAGIDADTAGVTVIGIGHGAAQPTITFDTATTADLDVDAASIVFENIHFRVNFADVAAAIDVNAADCCIRNCRFSEVATDMNALIWILGATSTTSNGLIVENCRFYGIDAANTHAISLPGTSDACVIRDNIFSGFYETAAIGAAGAVTKIAVLRNVVHNLDTDADACILLAASSTGIVAYNGVGAVLAADATTNISCGSTCVLIENYSVDVGDRQGVLDPAAT